MQKQQQQQQQQQQLICLIRLWVGRIKGNVVWYKKITVCLKNVDCLLSWRVKRHSGRA